MANSFDANAKPAYDFGRVLNRTFSSLRDHWLPFSLASLVIIGLPYFLINLIPVYAGIYDGGMFSEAGMPDNFLGVIITVAIAAGIVVMLSSLVLQAAVIHACVKSY